MRSVLAILGLAGVVGLAAAQSTDKTPLPESAIGQKTLKEALEGPERQIIREVLDSNG